MGKNFSRGHSEIFFLLFLENKALTFHANCLHRRQFAQDVKSCFSGENKENMHLLSAEAAKGMTKVNFVAVMLLLLCCFQVSVCQ